MKQRGKDEPPNDGRYDLRRSTVLEVLTRNQVRVSLTGAGTDLYPTFTNLYQYHHPAAQGLEIKIAEKLARLRALDEQARKK